jgi:hypothetical protein
VGSQGVGVVLRRLCVCTGTGDGDEHRGESHGTSPSVNDMADTDACCLQWPTINGEKPTTLRYEEVQWCQPIATMHHVGPEEVSMMEAFQRERGYAGPMLIKDVYHRFVAPHIKDYQQDWDNLSDDAWYMDTSEGSKHSKEDLERAKKGDELSELEKKAHESVEECRRLCQYGDGCLQWRFRGGVCRTGRSIRHGHPTKKTDNGDERTISGWNVESVRAWVGERDDCGEVKWPVVGDSKG